MKKIIAMLLGLMLLCCAVFTAAGAATEDTKRARKPRRSQKPRKRRLKARNCPILSRKTRMCISAPPC